MIIELDQHSEWEIKDTQLQDLVISLKISLLTTFAIAQNFSGGWFGEELATSLNDDQLFSLLSSSDRMTASSFWQIFLCAPLEPSKWAEMQLFLISPQSHATAQLPPLASCCFKTLIRPCFLSGATEQIFTSLSPDAKPPVAGWKNKIGRALWMEKTFLFSLEC